MKVEAGGRLIWRGREYEVVIVRSESVTLREDGVDEFDVAFDDVVTDGERVDHAGLKNPAVEDLGEQVARDVKIWADAMQRIEGAARNEVPLRELLVEEAQVPQSPARSPQAPMEPISNGSSMVPGTNTTSTW